MSPAEKRTWQQLVDAFPPDWLKPSDRFLLAEAVRAFVTAHDLAKRIKRAKAEDLKPLLQMRDVEARRGAALMTKLRMPPQSRSDRHAAGTAATKFGAGRSWEEARDDRFFERRN